MVDEEKTVNESTETNSAESSSSSNPNVQNQSEVTDSKQEATADSVEPKTEDGEAGSRINKRSAEGRIRDLVKDKTELERENQSLRERVSKTTEAFDNPPNLTDDSSGETVKDGDTVTPEQYERDVSRKAMSAAWLVQQHQKTLDRIRNETDQALHDNPELDPKSEKYDKELSDAITEAVESQVTVVHGYDKKTGKPILGLNHSASVKKIVERMMKPYRKSLQSATATVQEETTRQVANAALRPTPQVQKSEKSTKEMSIEEMEAKFGTVH